MHNITEQNANYESTVTCPEIIYNCMQIIRAKLDNDPHLDRHQVIKVTYPLHFGGPHHRYLEILNVLLSEHGYSWGMHSVHIRLAHERQSVALILRRHALIDLTEELPTLNDTEKKIYPLFQRFAQYQRKLPLPLGLTLDTPLDEWSHYLLTSPSALTVFKGSTGRYYYLYRCIFDLWEYNENFEQVGWQVCQDDYTESHSVQSP